MVGATVLSGSVAGGKLAAQKNLASNPSFYRDIGSIGGKAKVPKGFALMTPEQRSAAGKKGGSVRRRIDTSVANETKGSSSDMSTTKPGQKPASEAKQANVKPSRTMSSFLGRFKSTWLG